MSRYGILLLLDFEFRYNVIMLDVVYKFSKYDEEYEMY